MKIALSFRSRLRGLVRNAGGDDLLFFPRCRSVHTLGMRQPIDLAFLDEKGTVLASYRELPPWRIRFCPIAFGACERLARDEAWPEAGSFFPSQEKIEWI